VDFENTWLAKENCRRITTVKSSLDATPISSSECERGFSQMNLIVTPSRSFLINSILALLFIRIVEPALTQFGPTMYVQSWLLCGRHSAAATQSKQRSRDNEGTKKHDTDLERLSAITIYDG
jgi:hypothetical protein